MYLMYATENAQKVKNTFLLPRELIVVAFFGVFHVFWRRQLNKFVAKLDDEFRDAFSDAENFVAGVVNVVEGDRPRELVGDLAVDSRLEEGEHRKPEPDPMSVVWKVPQRRGRLFAELVQHRLVGQSVVVHEEPENC